MFNYFSFDLLLLIFGHILVGYSLTLLIDWDWIPLNDNERSNGISINEIKKQFNSDNS